MTTSRPPYDELADRELLLRDWLAIDRTSLANERTLLAYMRTGLAFLIVGGSLIRFFESLSADVVGVLFLMAGLATGAVGVGRFFILRGRLRAAAHRSGNLPCGVGGSSPGDRGERR